MAAGQCIKDRTNKSTFHAATPAARLRRWPLLARGAGGGPSCGSSGAQQGVARQCAVWTSR
jgi:hypothetical protein